MAEWFVHWVIPFGVSFGYIFLKATQQLNVFHNRFLPIVPCSMAMAFCEVTVVVLIIKTSMWVFLPVGLGGGLGCMLSMKLFNSPDKKS